MVMKRFEVGPPKWWSGKGRKGRKGREKNK